MNIKPSLIASIERLVSYSVMLFVVSVFTASALFAQDFREVVEEGDRLQTSGRIAEARAKFREAEILCDKEVGFYTDDMRYILASLAACAQSEDDYETYTDCLAKIDAIGQKIGYDEDITEDFLCFELCDAFIWRGTSQDVAKARQYFERGSSTSLSGNNRQMIESWNLVAHRLNYITAYVTSDTKSAAPILEAEYKYFTRECGIPVKEVAWDIEQAGNALATNFIDRVHNEDGLMIIDDCESILKAAGVEYNGLLFDSTRLLALANMARDEEVIALGENTLVENRENEENFNLITGVRYNLGRGYNGVERFDEGYKVLSEIFTGPYSYSLQDTDTSFIRSEMAYSLYGLGRYDEASKVCEEILKEDPSGTAQVQSNFVLSMIANRLGAKSELGYMEDYVESRGRLGYDGAGYAEGLIDLSNRYYNNYQFDKALEIIVKSVESFEAEGRTDNPDYYVALATQGTLCTQMEDMEQVQSIINKSQGLRDIISALYRVEESDGSTIDYDKITYIMDAYSLMMYYCFAVANHYYRQGILDGSLDSSQREMAVVTIKQLQNQIHDFVSLAVDDSECVNWLKNHNPDRLGSFYHINAVMMRDMDEDSAAVDYINQVIETLPESSESYACLDELRNFIRIEEDAPSMAGYIQTHYARNVDNLKEMINTFTSAQRNTMWNQYYGFISNYVRYSHLGGNNQQLNEIAYNSILLSKGLMLESDIDFESRILRSGDETILSKYREWKAESAAGSERTQVLERELVRLVGPGGDNEAFRYTWQDVKSNLKPGEYAVEFRAYSDFGLNQYLAYIIGEDYQYPKLVELCKEGELQSIGSGDNFDFTGLSRLVWSKIGDIIPEGATLYFSPDLQLHSFPLENLPDYATTGRLISDRWKLYRTSSTRQLVRRRESHSARSVDIYGGMEYTIDPVELVEDYNSNASGYRGWSDENETLRASVTKISDLPGSKREVLEIARLLRDKSSSVREYTGRRGTESKFKGSAGKEGNVLHISTHGFYIKPSDKGQRRLSSLLNLNSDDMQSYDEALQRSGLMMAGVNEVITGHVSPADCEDGLLTAKEISRMNLSNVDFAVLSACETGVGAISGDGVFGLQRGFKLAGVNSIMMSLWKVDDAATGKLITEFYKHWLEHNNAREALHAAQKSVRQTPGWEHPRYWAGFILLDALN